MKYSILIILVLCISLSGCAFFGTKNQDPVGITNKVQIDPKLLQPCKPIVKLPETSGTEDIGQHYVSVIGMYGECSLQQDKSIEAMKELANIKKDTKK